MSGSARMFHIAPTTFQGIKSGIAISTRHTDTPRPWRGIASATSEPLLEFSRFASVEGMDSARRLGYRLNERQEIELWLWPGLDVAPTALPARYPVLADVTAFELQYLNANLAWMDAWPGSRLDAPIPQAVRLRMVLASGEEIVRVFGLGS